MPASGEVKCRAQGFQVLFVELLQFLLDRAFREGGFGGRNSKFRGLQLLVSFGKLILKLFLYLLMVDFSLLEYTPVGEFPAEIKASVQHISEDIFC